MKKDSVAVAKGLEKADLVIKNGQIMNVYSKEIYPGGVAIAGDKIAAVGDVDYCIGDETHIIDAGGKYLLPGFIDGHIHPESTNLSIQGFAEIVLAHGTTVVMADMHEVGVVGGLEAIEAVLDEGQKTDLKIHFVVPSHVPFAPGLETSGGHFNSDIIEKALKRPDAVGLSEIVAPYLLQGHEDLIKTMAIASRLGKSLHGHLPDISGPDMNACMAAGVWSDHESLTTEDALERLRAGCYLMMREGSAARNMADCLKAIASSIGHDNHNIIVLGTNYEDMAMAVNRVAELWGGQVLINHGDLISEVAYPILGLLSDLDAYELAAQKKILNSEIHELGSQISIPFMFLSFICLAALPEYAVTDHGLIDVINQKVIDPVLEIITK